MVLNGMKVKFTHRNVKEYRGKVTKSKRSKRPCTECVITPDERLEAYTAYGEARLNFGENYNKEKGRKLALKRAIMVARESVSDMIRTKFADKSFRAAIWEAYRTSSSKPRW